MSKRIFVHAHISYTLYLRYKAYRYNILYIDDTYTHAHTHLRTHLHTQYHTQARLDNRYNGCFIAPLHTRARTHAYE